MCPAWCPQRRAAGPLRRSVGRGSRPAAQLWAGVGSSRHACRDVGVSEGRQIGSCCRTAGISRGEQVANRGDAAPSAGFGQITLGAKVSAFAGLTAFDWLGSLRRL